jgi:hypothetical protein
MGLTTLHACCMVCMAHACPTACCTHHALPPWLCMQVPAQKWDALVQSSSHEYNPFVSHAFLTVLEDCGVATASAGCAPHHTLLWDTGSSADSTSVQHPSTAQQAHDGSQVEAMAAGSTAGSKASRCRSTSNKKPAPGPESKIQHSSKGRLIGAIPTVSGRAAETAVCC